MQQKYIDLNGKRVSYWQVNDDLTDENTKTILCLHGWLDNAASFSPLLPYLNQHHCIVMEFAGHGESEHRGPDAYYHFIEWVYDVTCFIEQLNLNNVCLLGHSLGAMVASLVAASMPDRIAYLAMLEAVGPFSYVQDPLDELKKAFASRKKAVKKDRDISRSLDFMIDTRAKMSEISKDLAKLLIERNIKMGDDGKTCLWRSDPRLKQVSPVKLSEQQAKSYIQGIKCQTLVVLADKGYWQVRQSFEQRQAWFKHLRFQSLPGSHHFHMQVPQLLSEHLLSFFNDLEPC